MDDLRREAERLADLPPVDDPTRAAIASPNWDACLSCKHCGEFGCSLSSVSYSNYMGDWIICDDYEYAGESETHG
jgi:hypothetical protein